MFKVNKGFENFVMAFAAIMVTTVVLEMLPLAAQATLLLVVNLLFVTLGAQTFAALNIKVHRGHVRKRPNWASAYLALSLLIACISLGLMLAWTYQGFMTTALIEYEADRKASVILGWLLELGAISVFWYKVSWPSFLRKCAKRLEAAEKLAAVQHRRYELEEARRAAIKRAREERIHAEMYETHTQISAADLKVALDRLQEGQERLSNASTDDAEVAKMVMEYYFGEGTKVEDIVSIPADHYEILRQNRPEVEMTMASVRGGKVRHARRPNARRGQTIKFADLLRRRQNRKTQAAAGSQAQRLIEHQNKVGVRIAK